MGDVIGFPLRSETKMPTLARKRDLGSLKDVTSANVALLWDLKKWKQSQPRGRTIDRVRSGMANPELETLEYVAEKAFIPVWYLFLPGMDQHSVASKDLEQLVQSYLELDKDKRRSALDLLRALGR